jgi:hypothetical protein
LEARGRKALEVDTKSNITTSSPGSTEKEKTFRIPVSNGIFEHYVHLRDALWLLLWYIDRTTQEVEDTPRLKVGIVRGGVPTRDSAVAESFFCDKKTICRWRNRLAKLGYISQRITPFGAVVRVNKSKKWFADRGTNAPLNALGGARSGLGGAEMPRSGARSGLAKKTVQTIQDSTEEKAFVGASRPALFNDTKKKLFSTYSQIFEGHQPVFRSAEDSRLADLLQLHLPAEIVSRYETFLLTGRNDTWLLQRNFPFGLFAKKFDDFEPVDDSDYGTSIEDDRPPDWAERQSRLSAEKERKLAQRQIQ